MTELEQLIAKFDRDYPDDMRLAREALKTDPLKASDHLVCIDITDALLCHEIIRLRAELAELRRFRKVIMDYDSNLYDALANSDAARKGEGEK